MNLPRILFRSVLFVLAVLLATGVAAQAQETVVLRAARLLDVAAGRVVDGAAAHQFLGLLTKTLEEWREAIL